MFALLSSPLRRWLLATLLLPILGYLLAKIGAYLQRRNGGAPTRVSRALLGISSFTRRHSNRGDRDDRPEVIDSTPTPPPTAQTATPSTTT